MNRKIQSKIYLEQKKGHRQLNNPEQKDRKLWTTFPEIKTYCRTTVLKIVWHRHKMTHQTNGTKYKTQTGVHRSQPPDI